MSALAFQQQFSDVSRVLADEVLKSQFFCLSSPGLFLLYSNKQQPVSGPRHMVTVEDTCSLLSLPPASGGEELCTVWLLAGFGDLQGVISDAALRRKFCRLSFPVVRLWASLNENDVAGMRQRK
jgi:hypothetical protein